MNEHNQNSEIVANMVTNLKQRELITEAAARQLNEFILELYDAIDEIVLSIKQNGINGIDLPARKKINNGAESLSLAYDGLQIILIPSSGITMIDASSDFFQNNTWLIEKCGSIEASRVLVLIRPTDNISPAIVLGAFYLFIDGAICKCKMGSTPYFKSERTSEMTKNFAVSLVRLLMEKGRSFWPDPKKIPFSEVYESTLPTMYKMGFQHPEE